MYSNTDNDNDLLSPTQAARMLGMSRAGIHYAIRVGHLRATQVGRAWVIRRGDLVEWLNHDAAHRPGPVPQEQEQEMESTDARRLEHD